MAVLVAVVIALIVAAAVLLLASAAAASERDGARGPGPLQAFRSGWAARKHPDADQRAAAAAAAAEPVDLSLSEFLSATADVGDGYLHVDDLSETLHRAGRQAARALPANRHR